MPNSANKSNSNTFNNNQPNNNDNNKRRLGSIVERHFQRQGNQFLQQIAQEHQQQHQQPQDQLVLRRRDITTALLVRQPASLGPRNNGFSMWNNNNNNTSSATSQQAAISNLILQSLAGTQQPAATQQSTVAQSTAAALLEALNSKDPPGLSASSRAGASEGDERKAKVPRRTANVADLIGLSSVANPTTTTGSATQTAAALSLLQTPPGKSWRDLFVELVVFKQTHGHANPSNGHLGNWLICQKVLFGQGIHPNPAQVQLLKAIGCTGFGGGEPLAAAAAPQPRTSGGALRDALEVLAKVQAPPTAPAPPPPQQSITEAQLRALLGHTAQPQEPQTQRSELERLLNSLLGIPTTTTTLRQPPPAPETTKKAAVPASSTIAHIQLLQQQQQQQQPTPQPTNPVSYQLLTLSRERERQRQQQQTKTNAASLLNDQPQQQKKPPPSKPKLPIHKPTPAATKTPPPRNPPSRTNSNSNQSQLAWDERFAQLVAYEVENGHPNPPQTKGSDLGDYKLAIWLNSQRQKFRKGTLNSYKTKMLSELGCEGFALKNPEVASNKEHPEPSPSKRKKVSWNDRYQELKDFKARVGHANPHYGKGTAQCCQHLAQWLSNQRSDFRLRKKISGEQVQWLRELGCRGFEVETAAAAAAAAATETPSPKNFAQI